VSCRAVHSCACARACATDWPSRRQRSAHGKGRLPRRGVVRSVQELGLGHVCVPEGTRCVRACACVRACVCVHVRACARVRARACARACVRMRSSRGVRRVGSAGVPLPEHREPVGVERADRPRQVAVAAANAHATPCPSAQRPGREAGARIARVGCRRSATARPQGENSVGAARSRHLIGHPSRYVACAQKRTRMRTGTTKPGCDGL
jgi:hypothetical protein